MCIGAGFAVMEAVLLLARLAKDWSVEIDPRVRAGRPAGGDAPAGPDAGTLHGVDRPPRRSCNPVDHANRVDRAATLNPGDPRGLHDQRKGFG